MVLPSRNGAANNVPQTPDRQAYYQAGKGNILNHFAGLATPNVFDNAQDMDRARQSHGFAFDSVASSSASTATAMAPSPVDNNQRLINEIAASDDDHIMEDARSLSRSNSSSTQQPREVALSLWKLERQQGSDALKKKNGIPRSNSSSGPRGGSSRGKSISSRELRGSGLMGRDHANENDAPDEDEGSNQSDSMFTTRISPPRHQRSAASSRRSTLEGDPNAMSENRSNGSNGVSSRGPRDVALDASYSSDSYSMRPSMQFLARDLEEDERASKSTLDSERAFLYKKRYMDVYGLAVRLSDRITELENLNAKLRDSNSATTTDFAGSNADELRLESLCREVDSLSKELRDRDSMIASLHNEQQESVRTLNELKTSQAALEVSRSGPASQETQAYVTQLEEHVARLEREQTASGEQIVDMGATISALDQQLDAAKVDRAHMESSLRQTEEQLESVHTQWLKEKSDLLEAMDDTKRKLTIEGEKVRHENVQLKKTLQQHSESEKQLRSLAEGAQRTSEESKQYIKSLEAQLLQAHVRISSFTETETQLAAAQDQLHRTQQELDAAVSECDHLRHELSSAQHQLEHASAEFRGRIVQLETRIYQAEIVRRSLHNKVMELKGNIRVFCRVRPVLRHEVKANGNVEIFNFPDYGGERRQIELIAGPRSHVGYGQSGGRETVKKYPFDFDLVFNGDCSQEDVFLEVSALIQSALDGYDVCIFAYGQTGSGKTYTMQGASDSNGMEPSYHMGIVGRAIAHIYATIEDLRSSGWDFGVSLEMIEIYNETLRDLLAPPCSMDKVDLRLDSDGKPTITNSCVHPVENERSAWNLLEKASGRRSTKTTNMNDRSSRSHCVISFRLNGVNSLTGDRRTSVVHLVDLAGSERLSKSGVGNDREMLKETQSINKSLSSLGNVMVALAKKSTHVPFRDSKLTHFLSPSLGGDSKTLMICNLSPLSQHREETLNSLRFAKTVNSCEIAFPSYGSRS